MSRGDKIIASCLAVAGGLAATWLGLLLISEGSATASQPHDRQPYVNKLDLRYKPERLEPSLSLEVTGCSTEYGYTTTTGYVENTGEVTVNFVTVQNRWMDSSGQVVDTGSTFAVGREYLRPGERSEFRDSTRSSLADSCAADLDGWRVVR